MDNIITKIIELEKEARLLKEKEAQESRADSLSQNIWDKRSDEDWLQALRQKATYHASRPLVVLSLFDGIGGVWAALNLLGIPFSGYSCEINHYAVQVVRARYPTVKHLGNIMDLNRDIINEQVDLVVGGFPCQDLSRMGKKAGLHGHQSKLFFEMLRVLHIIRPKWFLAENVSSMTWVDRDEISKYLKCNPIEIDSQELTPSKRRRLYWTNILHPNKLPKVREHISTSLQSVLEDATATEAKIGCILASNHYPGGKCQLQRVLDNSKNVLRCINLSELERIMGFTSGHTDIEFKDISKQETPSHVSSADADEFTIDKQTKKGQDELLKIYRKIRWSLLGNSFSVQVISYLLSPLLDNMVWEGIQSFPFSEKVREIECSVMDVGEVWAVYNEHERPNWYAVILQRSGGRFSASARNGKKRLLKIEVQFLEMAYDYLVGELDAWSPLRGTGRYRLSQRTDIQDSWVSVSHRITGYSKLKRGYFVYPSKNEVWAIYQRGSERPTPLFVYVLEMKLDWNKLESTKPGKEGFKARCQLMQQTVQAETYRCTTKELEYTDLSYFSFKVPFYYVEEYGLFKLELSNKGRMSVTEDHRTRNMKKRRKYGESSDEEVEDESD
ncbi:hypothetical protein O6H91_13G040900 [Diphasiastrum complanatum]|uniref:Uncharacterized protein n=1 Tax=Diphasiastrum complanatum TaxID=34168 RepID=A0ACC2BUA8_DIPCM|nr:hypothetical protein O6H91_13G040900 [Diphasiastrum complanatum]